MADEVNIRLSVTGDAQVDAALNRLNRNFDRTGRSLGGVGTHLRGTTQLFNQFGNLARTVGNNQIAGLLQNIEMAVVGIRSMNLELGKSKVALAAIGAAGLAGGVSIGNQLRPFIPFFNEPDKLEAANEANRRGLEIANKILALKSPSMAADTMAIQAIDRQITEVEKLKEGWLSIIGIKTKLTDAQENELFQLRRLRDLTEEVQQAQKDKAVDRMFQDVNAETGGLLRGSQFGGGNRSYSFFSPAEGPQMLALERSFDDRLEQFKKFTKDKDDIDKFSVQNEIARHRAKNQLLIEMEQARLSIMVDTGQAIGGILGNLAETAKAFGKKGFAAWKAFSIAQATIATFTSAVEAFKSVVGIPYVGPALAPVAAAAAVAAGLANVAQIAAVQPQGYMLGGYTGSGSRAELAGVVHRGEFVVPADRVQGIGLANLEAMRAGSTNVSVGSPNVVNVMVNSQSELRSFLKSRAGRDEIINIVRMEKMAIGIS